jgi:hypothetical protein
VENSKARSSTRQRSIDVFATVPIAKPLPIFSSESMTAACCNTPIGNTPPNSKLPFIGLIHNCLSTEPASLDETFGPVQMNVSPQAAILRGRGSANGEPKPKSMGFLAGTLRVMGMVLRSRLDGSYQQNPFFVSATGAPIVTPKVLNR